MTKFKTSLFTFLILLVVIYSSCTATQVAADPIVKKEDRISYYTPFFETAHFNTKIYAATSMTALHKAAKNFSVNEMFIVDTKNDSLYKVKHGLENFSKIKNTDVSLLRNNLSPATAEDIEKFRKFKMFLNDTESIKLSYTTNQVNKQGYLDVYLMYSTSIKNKLTRKNLPLHHFTDVEELTIVDISMDKETAQ